MSERLFFSPGDIEQEQDVLLKINVPLDDPRHRFRRRQNERFYFRV